MLPEYPRLANHHVLLREWSKADLGFVESASQQPELMEGFSFPSRYTVSDGVAFIERQHSRRPSGVGLSFAIADPATNTAYGLLYLGVRQQPRTIGVGYGLLREARGFGLVTNAVQVASRWALGTGFAERVEAVVEPWNHESRNVMTRAGFQEEGLLRSYQVFPTRRADVIIFSQLPGDLEPLPDSEAR